MCTVTLSYNKSDKLAVESLNTLLATGLFVQLDTMGGMDATDDLDIDYSDPSLFEEIPDLPDIDRDLTPAELEDLIIADIRSIYARQDATV